MSVIGQGSGPAVSLCAARVRGAAICIRLKGSWEAGSGSRGCGLARFSIGKSGTGERAPCGATGDDTVRDGRHIDEEQYGIETPGDLPADTGAIHWVVTIDNGDDPPLALQTVRLEMRERTLCFDADRGANYTLYYGDTLLAPPRYDYATLFQPVDHPHAVAIGAEQANPHFSPRPDMRPFTERFRWLLWGALFCVVVVLGWVAVRTAGRMTPPD